MLLCMRTTIDINDALLIQAKNRAARERRTLTAFVEEALRAQLSDRPRKAGAVPRIPILGGGGTANPDIDWTSNASMLDFLEDGKPGR